MATNASSRTSAAIVAAPLAVTAAHDRVLFGVASLAAFAHTVDEVRIGELVALPFAALNGALVAAWPRLAPRTRAWSSIVFGLFWALAAIPYHLVPLVGGSVYGQHVSGLLRIVGGLAMVAVGVALLRRARS